MVDVRGGLFFAFSTVFSPKQSFRPEDIKLDGRLFPGIQEQILENMDKEEDEKSRKVIEYIKDVRSKIKEKRMKLMGKMEESDDFLNDNASEEISQKIVDLIQEKTSLDNLGEFLKAIEGDAQGLSNKIHVMNNTHLKHCLEIGKKSFKDLREITNNPALVVRKAIDSCFELFQVPKEKIKEYDSKDGEILLINDSREFSISFLKNDNIKEMQFLQETDPDKKHGFDVKWVHFNVSQNRWMEILKKMTTFMTDSVLRFISPRIGGSLGSLIKKTVNAKTDEMLVKSCNFDLKLIFHELLRTNLAIESIKFQNFEADLWNDEEKKKKLVEFGKDLLKSSNIANLIISRKN